MLKLERRPEPEPQQPRVMSLQEAADAIQDILSREGDEMRLRVLQEATAGNQQAIRECKRIITSLMEREKVFVDGLSSEDAAEPIYRRVWGLGLLEDLYRDPAVDEIRVSDGGKVFVSRRGKNEDTGICLSTEETGLLIHRMIPHDETGASLNEGSPILELVRADGSRLTALCRPVVKGFCFALRKHGTVEMTPEGLARLGTLDARVWRILSCLVRGRRNLLICGPVNSGKTTLLKMLVGELPTTLSIRILDTDSEIRARELYPDRDIVELEDHPEVQAGMKRLFRAILRFSPDVIIIGEFRGAGEAMEAIRACTRGHAGSMATAHFSSPEEAVRGTAMLMLEEGLNLPLELAMARVAQAFNVVVQMFADTTRGVKKVISITEIQEREGRVSYRELVRWEPSGDEYLGSGQWVVVNAPSPEAQAAMTRFAIRKSEIEEVFGNQR